MSAREKRKEQRKLQAVDDSVIAAEADSTKPIHVAAANSIRHLRTQMNNNDHEIPITTPNDNDDDVQGCIGGSQHQPLIARQSIAGNYTFYKTVFDRETLWKICRDDKPDVRRLMQGIQLLNRVLMCRQELATAVVSRNDQESASSSTLSFCLGQTSGKADVPSRQLIEMLKDGGICGFTKYDRHSLVYLLAHAESAATYAYEWKTPFVVFHDLTTDVNNDLSIWTWAGNMINRIASKNLLMVNRNRLSFHPCNFRILLEMAMNRPAIEVVGERQCLHTKHFKNTAGFPEVVQEDRDEEDDQNLTGKNNLTTCQDEIAASNESAVKVLAEKRSLLTCTDTYENASADQLINMGRVCTLILRALLEGSPNLVEQYNVRAYTEGSSAFTMSKDTKTLFHLSSGIVLSNFDGGRSGISAKESRLRVGTEANINVDAVLSHVKKNGGMKTLQVEEFICKAYKERKCPFCKEDALKTTLSNHGIDLPSLSPPVFKGKSRKRNSRVTSLGVLGNTSDSNQQYSMFESSTGIYCEKEVATTSGKPTSQVSVKNVRKRLFSDAFTNNLSVKSSKQEEKKDVESAVMDSGDVCKGQVWKMPVCTQRSVEAKIFHERFVEKIPSLRVMSECCGCVIHYGCLRTWISIAERSEHTRDRCFCCNAMTPLSKSLSYFFVQDSHSTNNCKHVMVDRFKPCNVLRKATWSLPDMDKVLYHLLPYEDTKRFNMAEQVTAHVKSLNFNIFEGLLNDLNVEIIKRDGVTHEKDMNLKEVESNKKKMKRKLRSSSAGPSIGHHVENDIDVTDKSKCDVNVAKLPVAQTGYKYNAFYIHAGRKIVVYDDFSRDTVKLANLILHELIHAAVAILCGWSCGHVGPFKTWQKYIMETLCPDTWIKLD